MKTVSVFAAFVLFGSMAAAQQTSRTKSIHAACPIIPMFIHDTVPPGEPDMKALRGQIQYSLEETKTGGRVVIFSTNKDAVEAVHQFLIFQIQEHKTGDPIQVP
jgi:hypothetical protein